MCRPPSSARRHIAFGKAVVKDVFSRMRWNGAKMSLYRADPEHGIAWITGGGTGIGSALALDLAEKGFVVAVSGLPEDPLDGVIGRAAGLPGRILYFPCDVTDGAGMARTVAEIEDRAGPIMLAVFNAGVLLPVHGDDLDLPSFRTSYDVNVFGVPNGLVPVVRRMHARNRGHVVIVGSITSAIRSCRTFR